MPRAGAGEFPRAAAGDGVTDRDAACEEVGVVSRGDAAGLEVRGSGEGADAVEEGPEAGADDDFVAFIEVGVGGEFSDGFKP